MFGIIKIRLYPGKGPKKYLSAKKNKAKAKKSRKSEKKPKEKQEEKRKGIKELVDELYNLITVILKRFAYKVKVRVKKLDITVATDDPAKTALVYSAVCNSLNILTELLTGYDKLEYRVDSMSCECDFLAEKFSFDVNIEIKVRVKNILFSVIGIIFDIINKK